jgi:glycosyltransferase involved in cell wall biosynthesis
MKLAVLTSHVIQYQTPLFKKLTKETDLTVYFCWDFGMKETYDAQFKKNVSWDIPLLDGFRWELLRNYSPRPSSSFGGHMNPGIISELIKNRPDAILVYGWNGFTEWMAFVTAWILGIKILIHSESPLNQEVTKAKWLIGLKKIGLGFLFGIMRAALYIGSENKKFYEFYGVPQSKLFFAPYAVDNERFISKHLELKEKREEIKKNLNLPDRPTILFVGKLMPKKNPGDLLEAFRAISEKASLVFVGDGELKEALLKKVETEKIPNVIFAGFKNQTELPLYYEAADIFGLPSGLGETWGLVINEAMCFEKPIIASSMVGCVPDLIREGENGYSFPPGDVEALRSSLVKLIDSYEREKFGKKSLEIIKSYSHEEDVKAILESIRIT